MKKWTNIGQEFDTLGSLFQKNYPICLIGTTDCCIDVQKKLNFLGMEIKINESEFQGCTVILCGDKVAELDSFASEYGLEKNVQVFAEGEFFTSYLGIFAAYVSNIAYFDSISFLCTTKCNLNCKYCLNFQPYIQNQRHYDFNQLKQDVDLFFSCIDRIGLFHVSGGEPLLYPDFARLMTYIAENYGHKIETLSSTTNCTILPSDDICNVLHRYNITMFLDDYTTCIPQFKKKFTQIRQKLEDNNIKTVIQKDYHTGFFKLFPPSIDCSSDSDEQLCEKYTSCRNPFTQLKSGKLYNCNWSEFAAEAGLYKRDEVESYDLTAYDTSKLKELIEYRSGFSHKGYVEFCKYCNGNLTINNTKTPPGMQVKGNLLWDKEHPTEIYAQNPDRGFQDLTAEENNFSLDYYINLSMNLQDALATSQAQAKELAESSAQASAREASLSLALAEANRVISHPAVRLLRKINKLMPFKA